MVNMILLELIKNNINLFLIYMMKEEKFILIKLRMFSNID